MFHLNVQGDNDDARRIVTFDFLRHRPTNTATHSRLCLHDKTDDITRVYVCCISQGGIDTLQRRLMILMPFCP